MMTPKELADHVEPWFKMLATVLAACWAIGEYRGRLQESRVAKTLAYVERFHAGAVAAAWQRIQDAWDLREAETLRLLSEPHSPDWTKRWVGYVRASVKTDHLEPPIATVVQFVDELKACADASICDGATARAFFKTPLEEFYHQHYCYLVARRAQTKDQGFGSAIEWVIQPKRLSSCDDAPQPEHDRSPAPPHP